uniref:Kelch repeat-containing protein n=1 Tax=Compsopogon caeruleus TaxID=31354 RepID=A0A7S1XF95_9RHOD|mmetsp:Transcript_2358/g.4070  ORF Transcript_2358/g.4070 Transcript_2358/m.4070 type:complete len:343 (+) Transcript_2358:42-1070(+)
MRILVVILVGVYAACATAFTPLVRSTGTSTISSHWRLEPNLSTTSRYENCAFEFDGQLFFMFGRDRNPLPISVYDPVNQSWTEYDVAPFQAHHIQCAPDRGQVVVGGAFGQGAFPEEKPLNDVYIYRPRLKRFRLVTQMPTGRSRGSCGVGVYGRKWYFAGGSLLGHGQGLNYTTSFFDEFDPETSTWTIMPDLPHPRDHGGVVIYETRLFFLGGQIGGAPDFWSRPVKAIDVFDFSSWQWSTIGQSRFAHGGISPAMWGNIICFGGGEYGNLSRRSTEFVDASSLHLLPAVKYMANTGGRHGFQMVAWNGSFYAGAGAVGQLIGRDIKLNNIERLEWNSAS